MAVYSTNKPENRTRLAISASDMLDIVRIKEKLDNRKLAKVMVPIFVVLLVWFGYYAYKTVKDPSKYVIYTNLSSR